MSAWTLYLENAGQVGWVFLQGDFDYVCEKTARVWLMQREPLSDFKVIGCRFFSVKYVGCWLPLLVFIFVRGRENSRAYKDIYGL